MTSKTLRRFLFVMGQNKQLHLFDPRTRGLSEPAKFFFYATERSVCEKTNIKKDVNYSVLPLCCECSPLSVLFFTGTQNLIIFH